MAQPIDEARALLSSDADAIDQSQFERFADSQYPEEMQLYQRLSESKDNSQSLHGHLIHQFLLSEYLRSTHAKPTGERIKAWLNEMKTQHGRSMFKFGRFDYEQELLLIAASHNQSVDWLRESLTKSNSGAFHAVVRDGEQVNFAFPGLTLRLADILDFDCSRTPQLLFRHLGLDDDLGMDLSISEREWSKHLAITGILFSQADSRLVVEYHASRCPHPVVEKSIRGFIHWIQIESSGARNEFDRQQREPDIHLSDLHLEFPEARAKIIPLKIGGEPVYIYEDVQFSLNHDEILQLLMGENLYGDPTLCIRELIQNSLDACELRELRLNLKAQDDVAAKPVDGTPITDRQGRFLDTKTGLEKELHVQLSWGFDDTTRRHWVQVADNGVGMTQDAVRRFFTQIGKSFYRSAEFREEQRAFRSRGLFATPISQFGIGILSSFMLADQIEVRTCSSHDESVPSRDITVSGLGSIFWFRKGTRLEQGTEIKLWLKKEVALSTTDNAGTALTAHFENEETKEKDEFVPSIAAAKWVVWPKYTVVVSTENGYDFDLNGRFHVDLVNSIQRDQLASSASKLGWPKTVPSKIHWAYWEWEDKDSPEATGSRVRLWYLSCKEDRNTSRLPTCADLTPDEARPQDLGVVVGAANLTAPNLILVNGMFVPDMRPLDVPFSCSRASGIWIDLRSDCAPHLTADRKSAYEPKDREAWHSEITRMFERLRCSFTLACLNDSESITPAHILFPNLLDFTRPEFSDVAAGLPRSRSHDWTAPVRSSLAAGTISGINVPRRQNLSVHLSSTIHAIADRIGVCENLNTDTQELEDERESLKDDADWDDLEYGLSGIDDINEQIRSREEEAENLERWFRRACSAKPAYLCCVRWSIAQRGMEKDLGSSSPYLDLYRCNGRVSNGRLVGPSLIDLGDEPLKKVPLLDRNGTTPAALKSRKYDLVFPTTIVPVGDLRRKCLNWRRAPDFYKLGVLPFVLPGHGKLNAADLAEVRRRLGVNRIYALMPAPSTWAKAFEHWTTEEWNNPEHISVLWDLDTGVVLWCDGTGDIEWVREHGKSATEFFPKS